MERDCGPYTPRCPNGTLGTLSPDNFTVENDPLSLLAEAEKYVSQSISAVLPQCFNC